MALMMEFLQMVLSTLSSRRDFELSLAYLALFLKLHRDTLWDGTEFAEILEGILTAIQGNWQSVDHLASQSLCLLQYLKCATL